MQNPRQALNHHLKHLFIDPLLRPSMKFFTPSLVQSCRSTWWSFPPMERSWQAAVIVSSCRSDSSFMSSTGDDQCLKIWSLKTAQCIQSLRDPRWGQIVSLSWLIPSRDERDQSVLALCIGTGRGTASFCKVITEDVVRTITCSPLFY